MKKYFVAMMVASMATPTISIAHIDIDTGIIEAPGMPQPILFELKLSDKFLSDPKQGFGGFKTARAFLVLEEFDCVCNSGSAGTITGWGEKTSGGNVGRVVGGIAGAAIGSGIGGRLGGDPGAGAGAYVGSEIGSVIGEQMIDRSGKEEGKPFYGKGSKF